MPVCILGIMGATRTGKSFFLNNVIRYLTALSSMMMVSILIL